MQHKLITVGSLFLFLYAVATNSQAETFPVIKNKAVLAECTDCHMAFPPQTLTAIAWRNMMRDLSNHFGEDVSMDPAVNRKITAYYVKNATDKSNVRAARKWRRGNKASRITKAPRFVKKHRSCAKAVWSQPSIKTKANCEACHKTMQKNGSTRVNLSFLPKKLRKTCGEGD